MKMKDIQIYHCFESLLMLITSQSNSGHVVCISAVIKNTFMIVKNIFNKVNSIMAPIFFNNLVVKKKCFYLYFLTTLYLKNYDVQLKRM